MKKSSTAPKISAYQWVWQNCAHIILGRRLEVAVAGVFPEARTAKHKTQHNPEPGIIKPQQTHCKRTHKKKKELLYSKLRKQRRVLFG